MCVYLWSNRHLPEIVPRSIRLNNIFIATKIEKKKNYDKFRSESLGREDYLIIINYYIFYKRTLSEFSRILRVLGVYSTENKTKSYLN